MDLFFVELVMPCIKIVTWLFIADNVINSIMKGKAFASGAEDDEWVDEVMRQFFKGDSQNNAPLFAEPSFFRVG